MKTKMTDLRLTSVFLPVLIIFSLNGCSYFKKYQEQQEATQDKFFSEPSTSPEPERRADVETSTDILAPNYPQSYVVVKGDTLWDIAKTFLKDPWFWPAVWHINPEIRNPHLIYPGDTIVLYVVGGKPFLTLDGEAGVVPGSDGTGGSDRNGDPSNKNRLKERLLEPIKSGLRAIKRSPSSRISGIQKAISTIPVNAIRPFLDRPRVVDEDLLDDAPHIVSSYEEHLISSTGNRIYARNITKPLSGYNIVRPGTEYVDPESGDVLGYEAVYLADARLVKFEKDDDKLSTLILTKASREVLNGDLLIPHENNDQLFQFTPRSPETNVKGQIMAVLSGVSLIGQHMVVVLNRGAKDGLAPGHVLAVVQKGATVSDPKRYFFNTIDLPDERAGIMMVFKTYKNLSYALIMEANRAMHINDRFENP